MHSHHLPPTDKSPSELFAKLLETPAPSEVIPFPRRGVDGKPIDDVRIQALSHDRHDEARILARAKLQKRGIENPEKDAPQVYGDAVARELIAMACLTARAANAANADEEPLYGRIFRGAEDVSKLRSDEVAVLFSAYTLVQHRYGPHSNRLSPEELDAWVARLAEGADAFPLLEMPFADLAELTCSLAARVSSLSRILASLHSSSPLTSEFDHGSSPTDTGSSTSDASERTDTGTASSPSEPTSDLPPLTLDEALRLARSLNPKE